MHLSAVVRFAFPHALQALDAEALAFSFSFSFAFSMQAEQILMPFIGLLHFVQVSAILTMSPQLGHSTILS